MGAWAVDAFGNDDACDWAYGLEEAKDDAYVDSTLSKVLAVGIEYLQAPDASEGIAAAEVVARMQGNFGGADSANEAVDGWVAALKLPPSTELGKKAHAVLDRVLSDPSELLELWQDSDDFEAWQQSIADIKSRIRV